MPQSRCLQRPCRRCVWTFITRLLHALRRWVSSHFLGLLSEAIGAATHMRCDRPRRVRRAQLATRLLLYRAGRELRASVSPSSARAIVARPYVNLCAPTPARRRSSRRASTPARDQPPASSLRNNDESLSPSESRRQRGPERLRTTLSQSDNRTSAGCPDTWPPSEQGANALRM